MSYDQYEELFSAMKAALSKIALSSYSDTSKQALQRLSDTLVSVRIAQSSLPKALENFAAVSESMKSSLPVLSDSMLQVFRALSVTSVQNYPSLSMEFRESIVEALRAGETYMSPEQRASVDIISPEILAPTAEKTESGIKFSFSNLLAILSILMSLVFFLIQQLPDDQLDEIAAQNEIVIEQNEELIKQNSEEIALLKQLADTGCQIADLLEDAGVEIEDLSDPLADSDQMSVDLPESDRDTAAQQDTADAVK